MNDASPAVPRAVPRAPGARILLVEDDPDAALYAGYVLANRGRFQVTHTADPAVALRLVAGEPWDLVLTEVDMPGMTGLELLAALRRMAPGLPVAVVTGHVPAPDVAAALRGLADDYLIKPLGVDRLLAAAATLIRCGARRDNLRS